VIREIERLQKNARRVCASLTRNARYALKKTTMTFFSVNFFFLVFIASLFGRGFRLSPQPRNLTRNSNEK
jgi:hypothetical protein